METDQVNRLFQGTARRYETIARITTLGFDDYWKHRMLMCLPDNANAEYRILDLACGTGKLTRMLARKYPRATVIGIDLSHDFLSLAEQRTPTDRYGTRVSYLQKDVLSIDSSWGPFDIVTASYLPKYVDRARLGYCIMTMKSSKTLTVVLHDFTCPRNPMVRVGYELYWLLLAGPLRMVPGWSRMARELKGVIHDNNGWPYELVETFRMWSGHVYVHRQPLGLSAILYAVVT